MATTLATELRQGFNQVGRTLPEEALVQVARARDSMNTGPDERNRLLAEIVAAYRAGPRQLWGPVILDLLAPALIELLQWIRAEPPTVDEEEIRQQLVLEVLRAAATIPIHRGGRDMKVRLLARAHKYVVRWLIREGCHQDRECSLDALRDLEE